MQAWKKDQGLAGSEMVEFLADKDGALTNALGLRLTGEDKPYGQFEGQHGRSGPLNSAPARLPHLLRARLVAPCSSALPG